MSAWRNISVEESDVDSDGESQKGANVTNGGNLSSRPPPKKRNRAALSCTLCRERKVKCDRVIPCQQCIKRGDEAFCHLDPNKRGPQAKTKPKKEHSHGYDEDKFTTSGFSDHSMAPPLPLAQQPFFGMAPPARHSSVSSNVTGSSQEEVDAIKARLAQLEYALSSQQRSVHASASPTSAISLGGGLSESSSSNGPSPRYPWSQPPAIGMHSLVESPANQTGFSNGVIAEGPRSGRRNPSLPSSSRSGVHGNLFASPHGEGHLMDGGTLQSEGKIIRGPATDKELSDFRAREDVGAQNASRGEVDSDTEDAALVLEGLAMSSRGECGEKKKPERMAIDIIEKPPSNSIQNFVDDDKAEDIMTEGKYRYEKAGYKKENEECSNTKHKPDEALYNMLRENPDAEYGPDGKRISPAKRVCVLLSKHESLFDLVYGPETFLGWGMGWAFPAAEIAGDMTNVSEIVGCKGARQREAVLRAIIRSLPQRDLAVHLVDIFDSRVKFLAGNCIHMPTFKKEMNAFYDLSTVEKRARAVNFVDPGWLALLLMIFVLALHFHPCEQCDTVIHLFDGRTIHLWRSASQTSLVLARYQHSTSISVLQTIILMNTLAFGTGKDSYHLVHAAITNALGMGLHRLGDKDKQPKPDESPAISIRREIAKRIWHHLTYTDWVSAPMHTNIYRIHPNQFNTPLPGNYTEDDLCQSPLPPPRPESEHTEMSLPLALFKLADVIRQHVDILNKNSQRRINCADMAYLDASYRGLLEQAPSFFRIGAIEGEGEAIEVERWLFQQKVFHKLLRLHRPQLSSRTSARTSCVLLARSILDMQRRIRSRCSIVDRLFFNLAQSFSAAIVLCLDLLQTRPSAGMRDIVRGEIFEALEALRHVKASHYTTENSIRVIEALLAEEEIRWNNPSNDSSHATRRKRDVPVRTERRKDLLQLALRVAKAANGHSDEASSDNPKLSMDPALVQEGREQQLKDQQSRQLFEQLLNGQPSSDEPSSFANVPFQASFLGQSGAPIGLEGMEITSGFTPPDAVNVQNFDLGKFLAECETNSSPGNENGISSNASDSGHSSLHGGGNSSSSDLLSGNGLNSARRSEPSSSPNNAPTGTTNGPSLSPSAFEIPSTGLDGFWNWVLGQGTTVVGNESATSNPNNRSSVQTSSQPQVSSSVPVTDGIASGSSSNNLAGALHRNLSGNGMGRNADSTIGSSNVSLPASSTSQNPFASAQSRTPSTGIADPTEAPFYSVGTPSAGVGNSWMSTPGLFDFAYEFGESNPPSTSQNSVSSTAAV